MADTRAYASVTDVATASGTRLSCEPYLTHPQFLHADELCAQLHYTFLHYAPNRSQSKGLEVRQAVVTFLDFRQKYHRLNPIGLHLNFLSDLTGDVTRQFERYLQKESKLGNLTVRAETPLARLKGALNYVAKQTGAIPVLEMPRISYDRGNKTEPLDESTFAELESALKRHVDKLRAILQNRVRVEEATPYTFVELSNIVNPAVTCESVVRWYQYALAHNVKPPSIYTVRDYLSRSEDPLLISMHKLPTTGGHLGNAWKAYYAGEGAVFKLDIPVNPFATKVSTLRLDEFRVLKTLLQHGYPLEMDLEELGERYDTRMKESWYEKDGDVLRCLLPFYCQRYRAREEVRPTVAELLNKYYPSATDMTALILFLMVQTGWNKETVLAIDSKSFEAKLSGFLAEGQMTIFSEKNRSQGNELPYYSPKLYKATSSRTNRYSAYNLIKLAEALSQPLAARPLDAITVKDDVASTSQLFLCLRHPGNWVQFGRFYSLSAVSLFTAGVSEFLKQYPIHENSRRDCARPGC
ncbi:MAG: Mobile element protein [uncultured Paraburkholderia sp.]|nr:MAG: Mobile element protein [uncultured Paraburkholderia sp.]